MRYTRKGTATVEPSAVAVALTVAAAASGAACSRGEPPAPPASVGADAAAMPCAPLASYCRPSDAVLLWGRCEEQWDREILVACATSPSNVAVKVYVDCQGYGVVSQYGVDFGRVLYFDSSKRLVGVEESFRQKHCYGAVPAIDPSACTLSRLCGGSPR